MTILLPIGHFYLRTRKLSPYNTNISTHIQISTAQAQHGARDSLGLAHQGAVSVPGVPQPCPLDRHHPREGQWHNHPSKDPSLAPARGELLQLSFEEHLNPAFSQALAQLPDCPALSTPAWLHRMLCSRSSNSRGSRNINSAWGLAPSQVWGKDDFLGSQSRAYSIWMKYFMPRVFFKYFQTFSWNK